MTLTAGPPAVPFTRMPALTLPSGGIEETSSRTSTRRRANTKRGKQAARRERVATLRARQKRAERRRNLITIGAVAAVAAVIIGVVAWYAASRSGGSSTTAEVIPPGVGGGPATVQAAAHQVPNTSGIPGVAEYVTTGWPTAGHNGPAAQALAHDHVDGPVTYSVTPPVGGPHNATWMNCGIYDQPVPSERGAQPGTRRGLDHLPAVAAAIRGGPAAGVRRETDQGALDGGSHLSVHGPDPVPGPAVPDRHLVVGVPAEGQLTCRPRLQQFVNKFRASPAYTPEYGGACTGGVGTPLQT